MTYMVQGQLIMALLLCAIGVVIELISMNRYRKRERCTEQTTGEMIDPVPSRRKAGRARRIVYSSVNGTEKIEAQMETAFIDDSFYFANAGERVPIWYDPGDPKTVLIGRANTMAKKRRRAAKFCAAMGAIAIGIICALVFIPKETDIAIGSYSPKNMAMAGKTPTKLVYRQYLDIAPAAGRTYPAETAKQVFDIVMNAEIAPSYSTDLKKPEKRAERERSFYREYEFWFEEEKLTLTLYERYFEGTRHSAAGHMLRYYRAGNEYHRIRNNRLNEADRIMGMKR